MTQSSRTPIRITPNYRSDITSWHGHQSFAIALMDAFRPKRLVELGVHYGDSLFSFWQGASLYCPDCEVVGVDTWEGDAHSGLYGEQVYDTVRTYVETQHVTANTAPITLSRLTFDEAADFFDDNTIDVLHIDGLHTYDAVRHDWLTWYPKMRPGGIVLLHDIAAGHFAVKDFWRELTRVFITDSFSHSWGLGIVYLNATSERSQRVRQLVRDWGKE